MTGIALIVEARTLVGVPWFHAGRSWEHGVDCAGLILLPAWRCGVTSFVPSNYSPGEGSEVLLPALAEECVAVEEAMQPGDIALFEVRRGRYHLAYLTGAGTMLHCNSKAGVRESRIDDRWQESCRGVWRWKGLA